MRNFQVMHSTVFAVQLQDFLSLLEFGGKIFGILGIVFAATGLIFWLIPQFRNSFLLVKDTRYRNNSVDDWQACAGGKVNPTFDGGMIGRNLQPAWFSFLSLLIWGRRRKESPFNITRRRLERWIIESDDEAKSRFRCPPKGSGGESPGQSGAETAVFENISDLLKLDKPIASYFRALQKYDKSRDPGQPIESLTVIEVNCGFAAPMFLLSGLLPRLRDDWRIVGESYSDWRRIATNYFQGLHDLISLQSFLLDCWLLWGPSISLPKLEGTLSCPHWHGKYMAAQFGFGDENNSINLIYERTPEGEKFLGEWMDKASVAHGKHSALQYPFALPAKLSGGRLWFADDRFLQSSTGEVSLPAETFGSAIAPVGHPGWDLPFSLKGKIEILNGKSGQYYSAYLWVLFVTLHDENGGLLVDLSNMDPRMVMKVDEADRRAIGRWRNLLTFFEHGNIADTEAYAFLEHHLAVKTAESLWRLASNASHSPAPAFVYGGALDDLNCSHCQSHEARDQQIWLRIDDELNRIAEAAVQSIGSAAARAARGRIIMPGNPRHPAFNPRMHAQDRALFVSYRRKDKAEAAMLTSGLKRNLSDRTVFRDVSNIEAGTEFPDEISHAIQECRVMLVVIGSHWQSRLDEGKESNWENDWVVKEIANGLGSKDCVVIPVRIGDAEFRRDDLPEMIRPMATLQDYWIKDMANLEFEAAALAARALDILANCNYDSKWKQTAETELARVSGCHLFEVVAEYYRWLESKRDNPKSSITDPAAR